MAGSGHLQTFKLLKYLRGRNSADGHLSFGNQMAVSVLSFYNEFLNHLFLALVATQFPREIRGMSMINQQILWITHHLEKKRIAINYFLSTTNK